MSGRRRSHAVSSARTRRSGHPAHVRKREREGGRERERGRERKARLQIHSSRTRFPLPLPRPPLLLLQELLVFAVDAELTCLDPAEGSGKETQRQN